MPLTLREIVAKLGGEAVGEAERGCELLVEAVLALGVAAEIQCCHPAHAQDERREFGGIAKAVLAEGLEGGEEDVLGEVFGGVGAVEVAQAVEAYARRQTADEFRLGGGVICGADLRHQLTVGQVGGHREQILWKGCVTGRPVVTHPGRKKGKSGPNAEC